MTTVSENLKTPLFDWHVAHGGRMVDFAGWTMPIQYTSIIDEHNATRTAAGFFDVSHMGRFRFEDPQACEFLNSLTTRRVWPMEPGRIRYSLMTRDDGGVLDDVLVYHLLDNAGKAFCFMVVNAGNREKILDWLRQHGDLDALGFEDRTTATGMIAIQGPRALEVVEPFCESSPSSLGYYRGIMTSVCGAPTLVSRTGYTGEDGCELSLPAEKATEVWSTLVEAADRVGGCAVGLAARDTLRLEAGMPLYGHELTEEINPATADVNFAINLKDREFPGRDAIAAARTDQSCRKRIGMVMEGKRPARELSDIYDGKTLIGQVTSGTFSPTLQQPVAMGYVDQASAQTGNHVEIDVRGKRLPATVCALPFYQRG